MSQRFEFVNVNEEGEEYAIHDNWEDARDLLVEFPNDTVVVRVVADTD